MIGIIDYGMGNLGSVTNACQFLELPSRILTKPEQMEGCEAVILPGVGAFGDCVKHLESHGFTDPIKQWIAGGRPFFGICLGLQMLFEGSDESPGVPGLGVFPGQIVKLPASPELKVPQMGWNNVAQVRQDCPLFANIPNDAYFYFVHSFCASMREIDSDSASRPAFVAGETTYSRNYASVVWRENVMAVQFHPEKSQKVGLRMLRNFADWAFERVRT